MQMIFQDPNDALDPRMTVRQSIEQPVKILRKAERLDLAATVAETPGFWGGSRDGLHDSSALPPERERLVLELGDKLDDLGTADDGPDGGAALTGTGAALEALRALGYSAMEAEAAVAAARRESADGFPDTEALVRAALRHL